MCEELAGLAVDPLLPAPVARALLAAEIGVALGLGADLEEAALLATTGRSSRKAREARRAAEAAAAAAADAERARLNEATEAWIRTAHDRMHGGAYPEVGCILPIFARNLATGPYDIAKADVVSISSNFYIFVTLMIRTNKLERSALARFFSLV